MKNEIRPSTLADIIEFYGKPSTITVRAFSIFRDGELVAISGVSMVHGVMTFFSDIKDNIDAHKISIWRASKNIVQRVRTMGVPVYAVSSEGSEKYIERLGFSFLHDSPDGKVYRL